MKFNIYDRYFLIRLISMVYAIFLVYQLAITWPEIIETQKQYSLIVLNKVVLIILILIPNKIFINRPFTFFSKTVLTVGLLLSQFVLVAFLIYRGILNQNYIVVFYALLQVLMQVAVFLASYLFIDKLKSKKP